MVQCRLILLVAVIVFTCGAALGAERRQPAVRRTNEGVLSYSADERGNRVPDFSHCGYDNANSDIPDVPVRIVVAPAEGDDGPRIQAAIDRVAGLPQDANGFRGTIRLAPGEFRVAGQIRINAAGVVLQGSGADAAGTVVVATGADRRALLRLEGAGRRDLGAEVTIADAYVPVGATSVSLRSVEGLAEGDTIVITRTSSEEWIEALDCRELFIGWKPGSRDVQWERTITGIDGDRIAFDAPITSTIDGTIASGFVRKLERTERLERVGVEDLRLVSDYDESLPKDEDHAWFGVRIDNAKNAWVRRIGFQHFAGGAVLLGAGTHSITVEDCISQHPVSEIGGYRRHTFFALGQLALFQRCYSEQGRHDFSVGHCAAGPNAFVQCRAIEALGDSGPIESWATGVLYDNVRIDGSDLRLHNRWNSPPKVGWSAANCVLWQCRAAHVDCFRPPGENNWAIGCWATHQGDGTIESINDFVRPQSLYQAQLRERVGREAAQRCDPLLGKSIASTSPTYDQAAEFVRQSRAPAVRLRDLIRDNMRTAAERIRGSATGTADIVAAADQSGRQMDADASDDSATTRRVSVRNGWIVDGAGLKVGHRLTPSWWRGSLLPGEAVKMGPNVSRFAPGRFGDGRTNHLVEVADRLAVGGFASYEHHYGLWYDRRRDDHLMVRRSNGDVLPPFYAQPFRRSGRGVAWDGLSRYDLQSYSPWYWNRLHDFAKLCDQRGLLFLHHNYFQHNILEAGAHWVDSPWRPANNINDTGLPEPPPFIGDKRIFVAEQFYNVSNSKLRQLHRRYIRQCLDAFADCTNTLQLTSREYTGPLHFVKFWLDTIAEWEADSGKDALVALSCTKDVQDAILADADYGDRIDAIDIRYWTYQGDFSLYAPPGGKSLAPRQHLRQIRAKASSFGSIVKAVREYRELHPDKAVLYNADQACRSGRDGWAVLMGGGSLADVRVPAELAKAIVEMQPYGEPGQTDRVWQLRSADGNILAYSASTDVPLQLDSPAANATYRVRWIDPASGAVLPEEQTVAGGTLRLEPKSKVAWLVVSHDE